MAGKKVYDLSVTLSPHMPVWPTHPTVEIVPTGIVSRDGYSIETLSFSTHTGTHIDAPYHFDERGATVDGLDLSTLVNNGYCLTPRLRGKEITAESLKALWKEEYDGSTILFNTGWSKKRAFTREFLYEFPGLTLDAAQFLLDHKVRLIGIDTLSIEPYEHKDFHVHKLLLGAGAAIIEDLYGLEQLQEGKRYTIVALPLKIKGASGSSARVVAIEE